MESHFRPKPSHTMSIVGCVCLCVRLNLFVYLFEQRKMGKKVDIFCAYMFIQCVDAIVFHNKQHITRLVHRHTHLFHRIQRTHTHRVSENLLFVKQSAKIVHNCQYQLVYRMPESSIHISVTAFDENHLILFPCIRYLFLKR